MLPSYIVCRLSMSIVSSKYFLQQFSKENVSLSCIICQDIEFNSWKIKDLKKKFSLLHIVYCSCVIKSGEVRFSFINVPLEIWCDVNLIHGSLIWKVSYSEKKKKKSSENKQYTTKLFSFYFLFIYLQDTSNKLAKHNNQQKHDKFKLI